MRHNTHLQELVRRSVRLIVCRIIKSFCKSRLPHECVNLTCITSTTENTLTDLSGHWHFQNNFINTGSETNLQQLVQRSVHLIICRIPCLSTRFKNNCFAVLRSSSKDGSYLRLVDFCVTQLQAESNTEKEAARAPAGACAAQRTPHRLPHPMPARFRVSDSGFRVPGFGFRVSGFGCSAEGFGFGFWV